MDSVFQKLEDIEMTAEVIVEHAEEEKAAIEKRLQEERDQKIRSRSWIRSNRNLRRRWSRS